MLSQPRGEGAVWNEEHAGPGCLLGGDGPPGVRWWSPRCSFACLRMHLGSWLARCMTLNQPGREAVRPEAGSPAGADFTSAHWCSWEFVVFSESFCICPIEVGAAVGQGTRVLGGHSAKSRGRSHRVLRPEQTQVLLSPAGQRRWPFCFQSGAFQVTPRGGWGLWMPWNTGDLASGFENQTKAKQKSL